MSAPALSAPLLRHLVRRLVLALGGNHRQGAGLGSMLALLAALTGPLHPLLDGLGSGSATHDPELCFALAPGSDLGGRPTGDPTAPADSGGHAHCVLSCGLGHAAAPPTSRPAQPAAATGQAEPLLAQTDTWISPIHRKAQARAPPRPPRSSLSPAG